MSYILLDVVKEMRILQPSSMVQVSKKSPDRFIHKALDIVKTGFGQPSIFNTDAIIQELLRQGKNIIDARNGGASGCVETGAFGTECYWLTGYFNLPKVFELTINDGYDERTRTQVGLKTGSAGTYKSFDELLNGFRQQLIRFVVVFRTNRLGAPLPVRPRHWQAVAPHHLRRLESPPGSPDR